MSLTVGSVNTQVQAELAVLGTPQADTSDSRGTVISVGAGAMDLRDRADGSLHLRSDGAPQIKQNGTATNFSLEGHDHDTNYADKANVLECRVDSLTAEEGVSYHTFMPHAGVITAVKRAYSTAPSSLNGAIQADVQVAELSVLNTSTESDAVAANLTLYSHDLTANATRLAFNAGDPVLITIQAPDDLVGGVNPMYFIHYNRT